MNENEITVDNELLEKISDYIMLDSKRYDGGAI